MVHEYAALHRFAGNSTAEGSTTKPASKPLFRSNSHTSNAMNNDVADPATREVADWQTLSPAVVAKHTLVNQLAMGVVDEFALHSEMTLCSQFPLHHFVFAQTASHMCHEANCESFFSLVKQLSCPNMFPSMLCK